MRAPNPSWHRYLRFWRSDPRADLEEELAFHLEARIDEYVAAGMDAASARAEAERRLGDLVRVRTECSRIDDHFARRRSMSDAAHDVLSDFRVALRQFRRQRVLTAAAIICLMLGIGANTAIFSVVDALLIHPLALPRIDRVMAVWETARGTSNRNEISAANYLDFRERARSFAALAAYTGWNGNFTEGDEPERVQGYLVTPNFFRAIGVAPALGRAFSEDEAQPGNDMVVILGDGVWRRRFGGDRSVIGRSVLINGVARTVVGVMPPSLRFPLGGELLAPLALTPEEAASRGSHYLLGVGRLAPGVTAERAAGELRGIAAQLAREHPETNADRSALVIPLRKDVVQARTSHLEAALALLMVAVGLVLLIACANVANLLFARSTERRSELALRAALGASRARLVRALLVESVVLGVAGGAAGVLLAYWGVRLIRTLIPAEVARFVAGWNGIGIDARVLGFSLALSFATALIFGLVPALRATRVDLHESLGDGAQRATDGRPRQRGRRMLVAAEVALTLLLLVGAGLMVRSVRHLYAVDPGFQPEGVATMIVAVPHVKYSDPSRTVAFFREVVERIDAIPGVTGAGASSIVPFCGCNSTTGFQVVGEAPFQTGRAPDVGYREITPGYLRALRIPVRDGRDITERDDARAAPVIIVNQAFARQYAGGRALGRRMLVSGETVPREIVGVVGNVLHNGPGAAAKPELYIPHAQDPVHELTLVARTSGDPALLLPQMRQALRSVDSTQPVFREATMLELAGEQVVASRVVVRLLSAFALIALALAAVGIYGVIAYSVSQRKHEIGIRMALGADRGAVLRMVIRQGMAPALLGLAIGAVLAAIAMRGLAALLYGVSSTDPGTYAATAALLAGVALVASWLPAREAARVDPVAAMRAGSGL